MIVDAIIEAEPIKAKRTAEVFIVLKRFGQDYWASGISYSSLESAQNEVMRPGDGVTAWRIVRVSDLPIVVEEGEV